VNLRLEELTPKMVKEIVQDMIKEHLGWLVIWGAVFGGLIGLASAVIK
jgi:Na+/H+ antiporter NhaD/arsenite permease-like protein